LLVGSVLAPVNLVASFSVVALGSLYKLATTTGVDLDYHHTV